MTLLPQPDASHFTVDPIAMWKTFYDTTQYVWSNDKTIRYKLDRKRVTKASIAALQEKLDFPIPPLIVRFWKEVGLVHLRFNPTGTSWGGMNQFLSPELILEDIKNNSRFINAQKYDGKALPFLWSEPDTFCIEVGGKRDGYITSLKNRRRVIATSFENMLREFERQTDYHEGIIILKNGDRFYEGAWTSEFNYPDFIEPADTPIYNIYWAVKGVPKI